MPAQGSYPYPLMPGQPYQTLPSQGQTTLVTKVQWGVYFLGAVGLILFVALTLSIRYWVDYCYWDFGLDHAESWSDWGDFDESGSISHVHDKVCGSHWRESNIEYYCPDACDNIKDIEKAGKLMLSMGIISCCLLFLGILVHIVMVFKKEWRILRVVYALDFLPAVFFVLGFIIYNVKADFKSYDSVHSRGDYGDYSPDDVGYEVGYALAVSLCILHPAFAIFAALTSYRTFKLY
eukprot:CAMPEP_0204898290 /NCGR_PEP_ID=MMETSP1397-20131031/1204_1 /ASSEMBLY_ACC=CAM_ASM_000891 /TAXON_ID=49980 /ORGANISM="Climacostomum Climacostomum virens, Strain Stock W-24" /LENGTH=234 /DNA_ID=CAMNT_0052066113 /DNA_START=200 /DNA_END=902 /DNA_ORIENTATION=+